MGLFNRRAETKQELDALRRELRSVRARLDESDEAKARLAVEVGRLDNVNRELTSHVGEVRTHISTVQDQIVTVASSIDHAVAKAASVEALEVLRGDVGRLRDLAGRVEAIDTQLDGLDHQLDGRIDARVARRPTVDPDELVALASRLDGVADAVDVHEQQIADITLVATDAAQRTNASSATLRDVGNRLDGADELATARSDEDAALRDRLGGLVEKVAKLDDRVDRVALELANQLTELSGDLETLGASAPPERAELVAELERLMTQRIEEHLADVTHGQERLAGEQARYAIQFRRDLAELADRLRRPGAR